MQIRSLQSVLQGRHVSLSESVARQLRMLAIEGFTALRRRGLEIGGLLLGHAAGEELRIEAFQEVPCEHRYGPSYVLSEADRENLTGLLAQLRGSAEWDVIGAYRSFTGRDPVIEPADEALVAEHFPQGDFVFLFLQPLSPENCVTSFQLFREGQLLPANEQTLFVLPPKSVPEPEPEPLIPPEPAPDPPPLEPASERSGELSEVPVSAVGPETPVSAVGPEAPPRPLMWKMALICMAAVLGGSLAYELGRAHRPLSPAAQWAELNLEARPAGGKLDVTWDAGVARSLQATRGTLIMTEGASQREMELNSAQVGAGRYTYAAERPDVTLRLTLFAGDRAVASESARLSSPPPVTATPVTPAPKAPAASADLRPEIPPSVVHEIQPFVPEGIRARVRAPIVIAVELLVNEHGRVIRAKAKEPGADGLRRYLAGVAEKAAREWRLTPARSRDGSPVVAAKTIQFVFTSTP